MKPKQQTNSAPTRKKIFTMENQYNHQLYDEQMRLLWQQQQTYRQLKQNYQIFTIDTPPPTVSGSLHIGHIFSYTHTDIIARYKRMTGHNVFYPFGFDCNGLATELFVEKKHNTNVGKIGREAFIDLCLATTEEMKLQFVKLWRTMGLSANLEQTYSTISKDVQKISQESFIRLAQKNYAYIKNEPALYCTKCRTTVAQAELDDQEQTTMFNNITFQVEDSDEKLIIATTRPELLPSCVAVLYHPNDSRYQHLKNQRIITPLFNQTVSILADEQVIQEKGSGLVMVCTFGDKTDIEWYKKHKLAYIQSIGFNGKFVESTPLIGGLSITDARNKTIELLKEQGLLTDQKQIVHSVNVHERCKHTIEYRILPQWFIKIVDNSQEFLQIADQINWYPSHMKSRFINWVTNLSWDWCISRQKVFGIPFPVWYCNDCSEIILADIEQLPIDPQKVAYNKPCPKCKGSSVRPDKDIMDTWNTSSVTPYICKQLYAQKEISVFEDTSFIPMNMRPQAHDIIRTWTFYTIVKTWMHQKTVPWHDVVISGYVLAENKEKISKSKGNAPTDPEKLLAQYAPDAIRYWTASATLGQDTAFSPAQIMIGQKLLTKLWNAFKFVHLHTQDKQFAQEQPANLGTINQWVVDQLQTCLEQYHTHLKKHEFSQALQVLEKLFWNDFCDNYLEIIKDQLFNPQHYKTEEVETTLWTLHHVSLQLLQLFAPYLPHLTEYLYQHIFKNILGASIHLSQLPQALAIDKTNQENMQLLLLIIAHIRKVKTAASLSLKTDIAELTLCNASPKQKEIIIQEMNSLKGVCKIKTITFTNTNEDSSFIQKDAAWFAHIDLQNL